MSVVRTPRIMEIGGLIQVAAASVIAAGLSSPVVRSVPELTFKRISVISFLSFQFFTLRLLEWQNGYNSCTYICTNHRYMAINGITTARTNGTYLVVILLTTTRFGSVCYPSLFLPNQSSSIITTRSCAITPTPATKLSHLRLLCKPSPYSLRGDVERRPVLCHKSLPIPTPTGGFRR